MVCFECGAAPFAQPTHLHWLRSCIAGTDRKLDLAPHQAFHHSSRDPFAEAEALAQLHALAQENRVLHSQLDRRLAELQLGGGGSSVIHDAGVFVWLCLKKARLMNCFQLLELPSFSHSHSLCVLLVAHPDADPLQLSFAPAVPPAYSCARRSTCGRSWRRRSRQCQPVLPETVRGHAGRKAHHVQRAWAAPAAVARGGCNGGAAAAAVEQNLCAAQAEGGSQGSCRYHHDGLPAPGVCAEVTAEPAGGAQPGPSQQVRDNY